MEIDFDKFNDLLRKSSDSVGDLCIRPTIFGERGEDIGADIINLRPNTTFAELLQAMASGVVTNLFRMFPVSDLITNGIRRIVLAGNASQRCYMQPLKRILPADFEVVQSEGSTAAYGAAVFAHFLDRHQNTKS
ncbi:hypothetical protein AB6A40_001945 [Gnathostoma spinigerum]|uniref:Carbohydrate kinase FGGY C-terminal domain-containing protein n=1 Tax=Gnathostoma spinigerum TaxID=75299 RepID=A0ABD6ECY7_9BILA